MLPSLLYLICLIALLPTVLLAVFFRWVDRVASGHFWAEVGRTLLMALELLGSPARLALIFLGLAGLLVAGCLRASRPWACLLIGVIGALSLLQVLASSRPTSLGQWAFFIPPFAATAGCFAWAWRLLIDPSNT